MAITKDRIAWALAIGLVVALNLLMVAVLYDAINNPSQAGISENATQILTGWGGGIIGVLGAVFGYEVGSKAVPQAEPQAAPQEAASYQPQSADGQWPADTEH